MKDHVPNVEPLKWILDAEGEARRHRANIVCWRNSRALLCDMVVNHAAVARQPDSQAADEPMRILGSTRQLVTCIIAMKARVFEWCARLHASGMSCRALDAACKKNRVDLQRIDGWEVGGMFSGITQSPEALVKTYQMLEKLTLGEIQSAAGAVVEVGGKAERLALSAADWNPSEARSGAMASCGIPH